jgi:hypothetical protein
MGNVRPLQKAQASNADIAYLITVISIAGSIDDYLISHLTIFV